MIERTEFKSPVFRDEREAHLAVVELNNDKELPEHLVAIESVITGGWVIKLTDDREFVGWI